MITPPLNGSKDDHLLEQIKDETLPKRDEKSTINVMEQNHLEPESINAEDRRQITPNTDEIVHDKKSQHKAIRIILENQ